MVLVKKVDGTTQKYHRNKVMHTCIRLGANKESAKAIAIAIEGRLYDGIPTKKILQMIYKYLNDKSVLKYQIDLRSAISLLRPKLDFEVYITQL